jgi:hypothetical protein
MTEYTKIARGTFVSTGGAQIINLPFQPGMVEVLNYSSMATPANHGIPRAYWYSQMGQGGGAVDLFNATPVLTTGVITSGGITTFSAGLSFQYGAAYQHTGSTDFSISKATAAVITTTTNHNLTSGNVVIFQDLYQTTTTGMPQIAGIPFTVTVLSGTTFSIPWNTNQTNYTVFNTATSTNNVGSYKQVLYPYLYAPGVSIISGYSATTTLGQPTTTVTTSDAHNFVIGQEVAIRMPTVPGITPAAWGDSRLNSLPNSVIPGSPIYAYVVAVTDYETVVLNVNSVGYTAYNSNIPVANVPGLQYPQILAVGDVNTGGVQISAGSALYPPPFIRPIGTTTVNSINGPAIQGSFFNNTSQGFIIGAGAATSDASSVLVGAAGNVIYWTAKTHDIVLNQ